MKESFRPETHVWRPETCRFSPEHREHQNAEHGKILVPESPNHLIQFNSALFSKAPIHN